MKVTDYIVEFFIEKGITDIFGYPGGVICHLIDSVTKYPDIQVHTNYHEQASAFAACGFAQETNGVGVAFSTSGPGATNLITGIANAYFDSIPTMFFTGQVDTYGLKGNLPVRQRGFQETDIVSMVKSITKYAVCVEDPINIKYELEKAYAIATQENPGPVLIDLPADVQRAEIEVEVCREYKPQNTLKTDYETVISELNAELRAAKRPCLLVGNGVKQAGMKNEIRKLIETLNIPSVFSMPAFDTLDCDNELNFGFIGANGHRYANFVVGKSDLIIAIGTRMDCKQVGNNREAFASQAKIVRIDIDAGNLVHKVHKDEVQYCIDLRDLIKNWNLSAEKSVSDEWTGVCRKLKDRLQGYDDEDYTKLLRAICRKISDDTVIVADVGQSQVWLAQQLPVKKNQSVHMSGGLGTMGYSLPAAIGAYYGSRKPVVSFNGDGGIQMNIQELQFLFREQLPIKVVILNNRALGMIRGFQEANFNRNYSQTMEGCGYSAPDFGKIAAGYGLGSEGYIRIKDESDLEILEHMPDGPVIIEVTMPVETSLNPNFGRNELIQDQRPYLERDLFMKLMDL